MSCNTNFTEWTREQKEELAERRMREMKEKNDKLLKRYAEVENDRIEAESRNSAITNVPKAFKKEDKYDVCKTEYKTEHAREWDRGKPDKDNWKSPDHRGSYKSYRTGYQDKNDTWGSYAKNESSDHYRHDRVSEMQNRKSRGSYRYKQYDDQQNSSRFHRSPKRARGATGYRNNESHRNSHSYSEEKYKKSDYSKSNSRKKNYRAHSRSSSRSESDFVGNNISSVPMSSVKSSLWQNYKISEDQTKQTRVEKWVNSVNKSNFYRGAWPAANDQTEKNRNRSYSKFDRFEHPRDDSSPESTYRANFNASAENKSRINNNIFPKPEFQLNKHQNSGTFSHNVGSSSAKQNDRNKSFKTKSPQYASLLSGKNDQYRKRRFDNKGFKNDDKFVKSITQDNDSWNTSVIDNRHPQKEKNSNFGSASSWSKNNDTWGTAVQSQVDDGWEATEQSDIKWKLSDEETDVQDTKNLKHISILKKPSSGWEGDISCNEKVKLKEKYPNEKQGVTLYDDPDKWPEDSNLILQEEYSKSKLAVLKNTREATDGWEDYESSYNEISEKMEKKCKIGDKMEVEGADNEKVFKNTNLNVKETKQLKQSSHALSKKSQEKTAAGSDGWSTVEEGELQSDEDPDSEWKKGIS